MPQAKLKIDKNDWPRLQAAADFLDIKVATGSALGNKAVVITKFKKVEDLFELGFTMSQFPSKPLATESAPLTQPTKVVEVETKKTPVPARGK